MRLEVAGVPLPRGAQGVEGKQFGRGVARLQCGAAFRLFPLLRAEGMQRRAVGIGSRIAGDDVQLRDRDIEPGIVGVMQLEELGVAFTEIEMDEPW